MKRYVILFFPFYVSYGISLALILFSRSLYIMDFHWCSDIEISCQNVQSLTSSDWRSWLEKPTRIMGYDLPVALEFGAQHKKSSWNQEEWLHIFSDLLGFLVLSSCILIEYLIKLIESSSCSCCLLIAWPVVFSHLTEFKSPLIAFPNWWNNQKNKLWCAYRGCNSIYYITWIQQL